MNDAEFIQRQIDRAPTMGGFNLATIQLDPGDYIIDQTIHVTRPVRIVGSGGTRIVLSQPDVTAFLIERHGSKQPDHSRIEDIWFTGWHGDGSKYAERGGVALNIRAPFVEVAHCMFEYLGIGVFMNDQPSDDGTSSFADKEKVHRCRFQNCIKGLHAQGGDANAGDFTECSFTDCRMAIHEESQLGNRYANVMLHACPDPADPHAHQDDSGSIVIGSQTNYSHFEACYIERDSKPPKTASGNVTTVGGNMCGMMTRGEIFGGHYTTFISRIVLSDGSEYQMQVPYHTTSYDAMLFLLHTKDASSMYGLVYDPTQGWHFKKL
ncbi:hypothetical protein ACH4PU_01005 [Streptomyces sp. NPDC021100]|uniref:hypothetical protein n=1 Tax=Streptomyces sp. NPDC021100 TaxID=3365114 RepID=UPI00378FE65D